MSYPKVAQLKDTFALQKRLAELRAELPIDERILTASAGSPLAEPIQVGGFRVGNRWCIHPMEGWDANRDGSPSLHTLRRWKHFGLSGAKWIWGGEAAAAHRLTGSRGAEGAAPAAAPGEVTAGRGCGCRAGR